MSEFVKFVRHGQQNFFHLDYQIHMQFREPWIVYCNMNLLDMFPLIWLDNIGSINKVKMIMKFISWCDIIDKNWSVFKFSTYIIASIAAWPIQLTAILVIMSISTFKTDFILYLWIICKFSPSSLPAIISIIKGPVWYQYIIINF